VELTRFTKRLQLFPIDGTGDGTAPNWSWLDTAVLGTLFDYVALTYGRDHVPGLVLASRHHETWESLIPALFAMPAQEFEAGWLAYLEGQIGHGDAAGADSEYDLPLLHKGGTSPRLPSRAKK
jgi:hypothetical protein